MTDKSIDLQERVTDAEACYQEALSSFGADLVDIDEVIRARRALCDALADLECEELRTVCETVKFGPAFFEQMENLPVM